MVYMNIFDIFKKKNSGNVAKDRLKLLLVSDRANCSPEIMEQIKNDIINVIINTTIIQLLLPFFDFSFIIFIFSPYIKKYGFIVCF